MTCNVVWGLLFPSLNLTFMGHFPGNSDFLKYITSPLTLPDGRNETWLLCGEALRITKEVLSLYPDLWVSRLFIGLLFSLRSHSSVHPAFACRRCGAWRKMFEASPGPYLPPQRLRALCLCTLVACVRPSLSVLLWEARTSLPSLHPRERPHSPQLHPCSSYPCSGLSSGRSL